MTIIREERIGNQRLILGNCLEVKMMVLLKLARSENGAHNNDDYIDMAGYAAIAGELEGRGL